MKRTFAIACVVASISACGSHAGPSTASTTPVHESAPVDVDAERAAILAAERSWAEAIAARDVDRVLAFFADDGASLPPDEAIIVGTDHRRAYLARLFAEPEFDSSWETTRVDIARSGDMALSMGTTTHFAGRTPDGRTITEHGKYVTVWKKDASGRWLVVADIWNSTGRTTDEGS